MIIKVEIEGKIYNVSIKDVHSNPVLAEVDGKSYQVYPESQGPAQSLQSLPKLPRGHGFRRCGCHQSDSECSAAGRDRFH